MCKDERIFHVAVNALQPRFAKTSNNLPCQLRLLVEEAVGAMNHLNPSNLGESESWAFARFFLTT